MHIRPGLAEIMKILDVLNVTDDKWQEIITIARDAAERGWWDAYGDAMGARQRLYADIESGAKTISEYNQFTIPGVLQTPDFTRFMIEMVRSEGALDFLPARMMEARLRRQGGCPWTSRAALRSHPRRGSPTPPDRAATNRPRPAPASDLDR
ncbi:hypothetical protein J4573_51115 [Actinomadura barringtoniae]|uniref:DUF5753 domain-containing protein n=1 Tax=Actinomadura barringtoniae TaxID=1427535 RepID=A0A939PNC7_9ACTN|nr:Scr1 family TA system antitoxin-like transcriptional regulator [Actinomadura barringtoniae]MBO2455507.1 hypothetical protein [Actinomadura barringtoniae]